MDSFIRAYPPAQPDPGPVIWLPFHNGSLLVERGQEGARLVRADLSALVESAHAILAEEHLAAPLYLGTLGTHPVFALALRPDTITPEGWRSLNLRALYGQVSDIEYALAGYAVQMLEWQRTSRFCPVCAQATEAMQGDWGRRCSSCGYVRYPPVSPAVLMLVHDSDMILLGHKEGWGKRYSILAGFVEPGETLEECAAREVLEEVNVRVTDIRYHGSQPWPFPHQIMLGFTGRYAGGDIRADQTELDDARWFRYDDLPELPPPLSLSRQLIDAWVASRHAAHA